MRIVYVMDFLCGWCYVASPVVKKLYEQTQGKFEWEIIHINFFQGDTVPPLATPFFNRIREISQIAKEKTGIEFSEKYFQLLESGDFDHTSTIGAFAFASIQVLDKNKIYDFYQLVQKSLFTDGININHIDTMSGFAESIGFNKEQFIQAYHSEEVKKIVEQNTQLGQEYLTKLEARGIPALFIEQQDGSITRLSSYKIDKNLEIIHSL